MKIVLIVEGQTEKAFKPVLREFLRVRLAGAMPSIKFHVCDGRLPTDEKLRRIVERYLSGGNDAVIALTDVYTGTREFTDAKDAKTKMAQWVGRNKLFYPHAAQYDFEAWLLPFWDSIQKLAGSNKRAPGSDPEAVNHDHPPAHLLREVFRTGSKGKSYVKPRDAGRILRNNSLVTSADSCPELKAFLNTILELSGGALIS